ncbi:hypothetical protein ABIB25_002412 [Nakamurella sp. UYEF19]|uniref:hypothetical protein n=1 Tax=Nakamurella sp. UYEF19 TaxID=1756392 RepID=UPI0033989F5B
MSTDDYSAAYTLTSDLDVSAFTTGTGTDVTVIAKVSGTTVTATSIAAARTAGGISGGTGTGTGTGTGGTGAGRHWQCPRRAGRKRNRWLRSRPGHDGWHRFEQHRLGCADDLIRPAARSDLVCSTI